MLVVRRHMEAMSLAKKQLLAKKYTEVFCGQGSQHRWGNITWQTSMGITYVTLWTEEHVYNNLRLAMIKEMMGIGPCQYCVICDPVVNFESKLLLLVHFLPHAKFSMHPSTEDLKGPFLHSPWREIGEGILSRPLDLKDPFIRTTLHSVQHKSFLKTGVYRKSSGI